MLPLPVTPRNSPSLVKHTLLWRVEGRVEAFEELLEAEFPVSIFIRQFNESVNTESSETKHRRNGSLLKKENQHQDHIHLEPPEAAK